MTADIAGPRAGTRAATRAVDLRLARLHLHVGSLALARAELEAAHGDEPLAADSLVDLAEARWRSGDLAAAGEAARTALANGAAAPIAAVIAIEAESGRGATATRGREDSTGDASSGADAARVPGSAGSAGGAGASSVPMPELSASELDRIFAGMPRGPLWPPDPAHPHHGVTDGSRATGASGRPVPARAVGQAGRPGAVGTPAAGGEAASREWRTSVERLQGGSGNVLPNGPSAELDAAADDLAAGEDDAASIRLGVLLRLEPATAPAVAGLLEDASAPGLLIVRGDALRLLGRGAEAERAWAQAAAAMEPGRPAGRPVEAAQSAVEPPPPAPATPSTERGRDDQSTQEEPS